MTIPPPPPQRPKKSPLLAVGLGCLIAAVVSVAIIVALVVLGVFAWYSSQPKLQQITFRSDFPLLGTPVLYETFRNTGGKGSVLITVTQADHTWKRIAYYDKDEQREIKIPAPGLQSGNIHTQMKPTSICTPEELSGVTQAE